MKRAALLFLVACGTLSDGTEPSAELPSAEMGPFRALQNKELKGTAPFVLDDSRAQYSDPAALADGSGVVLYAVTGGKIVRTRSLDGRTFYGIGQAGKAPAVVLAPDQPWEGAALAGPFAFRRGGAGTGSGAGGEVLLFYSAPGGIGVARSTDGLAFTKEPGPVLSGAAPSVFALPSGELRMLFTTDGGIAEASSADGLTWQRRAGLVLAPSGAGFDAVAVADPCVVVRTTPAGRFHVRVLYTGTDATGAKAIGFAARYGDDGPLTRNAQPALATGAQPAYVPPFLYVTQTRLTYPAVAAAVEPLDAVLGAPADFPAAP